jgi:hypothetical protein
MFPTKHPQFNAFYKQAEVFVKDHAENKDKTSLRLAAFACGRLVGYHMAITKNDPEACAAMDVLEVEAIKAGVQ